MLFNNPMIFIVSAIIIGLGLGFLSFYHQNFFLACLLTLCIGLGIFMRPFLLLAPTIGAEVSETGQREGFIRDNLNVIEAAFDLLSNGAQTAFFVLPVAIIMGRFLSWAHYVCFPDYALPRTEEERRAATMNNFSYKRSNT